MGVASALADSILAARGAMRLAYHFEGTAPTRFFEPPERLSRQYRNPIALAQEWQSMLDEGKCAPRTGLARSLTEVYPQLRRSTM